MAVNESKNIEIITISKLFEELKSIIKEATKY